MKKKLKQTLQVTIFGESAGSVCVLAHVLSPQSKGLFHAAIAESGSPMSVFARQDRKPAYYARYCFFKLETPDC